MTDTAHLPPPPALRMTAIDTPEHDCVLRVTDTASGLHALIAIHNRTRCPARGVSSRSIASNSGDFSSHQSLNGMVSPSGFDPETY